MLLVLTSLVLPAVFIYKTFNNESAAKERAKHAKKAGVPTAADSAASAAAKSGADVTPEKAKKVELVEIPEGAEPDVPRAIDDESPADSQRG